MNPTEGEEQRVLHGSGDNYLYVQPQPAFDFYRESRRYTAIYATTVVGFALSAAVFNRRLARTVATLENDISAMSTASDNGHDAKFTFIPIIYQALAEGETDLLHDGQVYELPQQRFTRDPDAPFDWYCPEAIGDFRVYHINRDVGILKACKHITKYLFRQKRKRRLIRFWIRCLQKSL